MDGKVIALPIVAVLLVCSVIRVKLADCLIIKTFGIVCCHRHKSHILTVTVVSRILGLVSDIVSAIVAARRCLDSIYVTGHAYVGVSSSASCLSEAKDDRSASRDGHQDAVKYCGVFSGGESVLVYVVDERSS